MRTIMGINPRAALTEISRISRRRASPVRKTAFRGIRPVRFRTWQARSGTIAESANFAPEVWVF